MTLSVAVASAIDAATAILRPLTASQALSPSTAWQEAAHLPPAGPPPRFPQQTREPLESSEPETSAGQDGATREQAVEAAMPEIRASIERLLAASQIPADRTTPS